MATGANGSATNHVKFPSTHHTSQKSKLRTENSTIEPSQTAVATSASTSWTVDPWARDILVLSTVIKLALFPAYRSTDFEVHRNWLAITNSLPLSQWYYDTTSEWTLDYPPFFAYFEYLLSIPAKLIDPRIVDLNNLKYDGWSVIAFQRGSVIITELVMGLALIRFIKGANDPTTQRILSTSLFLHPGFLIVDHVHFQYNGFMFGVLLWSILMARNGHKLASGVLFAVLLNFKHIYMYLAPAYFIYLLRSYCMSPTGRILPQMFVKLGASVILIFALSFGPFILLRQIPQVFSRLFPFTRGLNHAYWAPNVWALITTLDRVLLRYAKHAGTTIPINESGVSSTSRGLVGDTVFAVLPNIKPMNTFLITIAFQAVVLVKLWRVPTYKSFVAALTLCGWISFMFGWHVHEKAILMVLVPLSLLATENHQHLRIFAISSISGIFSLFPLLLQPAENFVQIVYTTIWIIAVFAPLQKRVYEFPKTFFRVLIDRLEMLYLLGFPFLQLFKTLYPIYVSKKHHGFTTEMGKYEFLPLMLTSVYCAVGLVWGFLRLTLLYLTTY